MLKKNVFREIKVYTKIVTIKYELKLVSIFIHERKKVSGRYTYLFIMNMNSYEFVFKKEIYKRFNMLEIKYKMWVL